MKKSIMEPREYPATWFAELCVGGRLWQEGRAGSLRVTPRQTSRKDTSRLVAYRIASGAVELSCSAAGDRRGLPRTALVSGPASRLP